MALIPVSLGIGAYFRLLHCFSVPVELATTVSLKTKLAIDTRLAVSNIGASTWCAESPAARMAITSLFWLSGQNVNSVASRTE